MKKAVSLILSVLIIFLSATVGVIEIGKDITDRIEKKQINKLYSEVMALDGEIESRLVITSKKHITDDTAVQSASGYNDLYIFQYASIDLAKSAYEKFSDMSCVENIEYDKRYMPCDDQMNDSDDARCIASASDNIDDMLKLIKANYSDYPEIKIAVIDSGCEDNELTHGRVINIGNTVGNDCDHGTLVCGTILYNTLGNVTIYSYDVGDADGFSSTACTTAMLQAMSDGCKIINMSYGLIKESTASEYNAVVQCNNRGIIMIASAGNDATKLTSTTQFYPCCYNYVIGIGALSPKRAKASFSNYGTGVDYYTIGQSVRSFQSGSEVYWNGTSSASPVAASIVANLMSVIPDLTYSQLNSAIVRESNHDDKNNYRYIDAYATLSQLTGKALPQAEFTYTLRRNASDGKTLLTVHCDEGTRIYCRLNSTSQLPFNNSKFTSACLSNNNTVLVSAETTIIAVAYADGMRKGTEQVITAPVYDGSGYTFDQSTGEISYCQDLFSKEIIVPAKINGYPVTSIGDATFAGNQNVETIIIPDSVKTIGGYAFANCSNLKRVVSTGSITLGRYAFANCPNLEMIYFPSVINAYIRSVYNCPNLVSASFTALTLPTTVTFEKSDNILNFNKTSHHYKFECVNSDSVTYKCVDCTHSTTITVPASELKDMWCAHIVGVSPVYDKSYDTMYLFDVTGDGIINAKDYYVINKLTQ